MKEASPSAWSFDEIRHRFGVSIVLGAVSIVLIIISGILLIKSVQTTSPIQFSSDTASNSGVLGHTTSQVVVDIQGAVARSGVYKLPEGSRVEDAIIAAGGLTKEADNQRISQTINRAAIVADGGKLYFPKISDSSSSNIVRREGNTPGVPSQTTDMVNINMASQAQLDELAGVGPVTAQKIIDGRPYQVLTELVSKKAMSQSVFDKVKDRLTL